MSNLEQIGLDAVDKFITTWNSRDPVAWADSLNFPHVRPAPRGDIVVSADADEYVKLAEVAFERAVAMGWDHSEWDYKQVLHMSSTKIHVVGQWSRYTEEGEKILTNPIVYIVTNKAGKWGIQSRFSADYAGDEDTSGLESRGFKLIETWAGAINTGNRDAAAELINYPYFDIGAGTLDQAQFPTGYPLPAKQISIESLMALQTGNMSMNAAADFMIDTGDGAQLRQAVINLNNRDDHLGIQAISMLDPAQTED